MRYILIFMLFTSALFGQQQSETIRGSMITITNVPPTFVPGPGAPWFAKVITTGDFYEWDWVENTWHNTGARLYETGTSGVPTYVPGVSRKEFAINLEGELYYWTGSWNLITPDLSGYIQYSDSLTTFVTPSQLSDSLGGHLTWSDTATLATQYYVNSQGFLTVELDGDSTNELQTISRSNDTIFLSDGGFAVLPPSTDTSGFNQSMSYSIGDTLYLTDANGTLTAKIPLSDSIQGLRQEFLDSLALIPTDTVSLMVNDTVIGYFVNGGEVGRDTIRTGVGLTGSGVANYLTRWSGASSLDTTGLYWNGWLGHGTTSPLAALHIQKTSGANTFLFRANNTSNPSQYFQIEKQFDAIDIFKLGGANTGIQIYQGQSLGFYVNNFSTAKMTLNLNGELGLGLAPISNTRFAVQGQGSTNATPIALFENSVGQDVLQIRGDRDLVINGDLRLGYGVGLIATNLAFGLNALNSNTTGSSNVAFAWRSMENNQTGSSNVSIGSNSMRLNVGGLQNMSLGAFAAYSNINGSRNVSIGNAAQYSNTGSDNVCIGDFSGFNLIGNSNTTIGQNSARYNADGSNLISATQGVYIGADARASANSQTNEIVIGAGAEGNGSNTFTGGNTSVTDNYFNGRMHFTNADLATNDTVLYWQDDQIKYKIGGGVQYSDSLTVFVTPSQLVDSINAIPAVDLTPYVEYADSLTTFVTPTMLDDSTAAIRGDFPVNTDDQTLSIDSTAVTGGRQFTISIEDGNSITFIDSIGSGGGGISGSGTTNYVSKWTGTTSQGNSIIQDNGTEIGINTAPVANITASLTGSGSTSATASFSVRNSLGDYSFYVRDDNVLFSNAKRFNFGNSNLSVYIGNNAGINTSGIGNNVAIGYLTGASLTTGGLNLLLGSEAGNALTTGEGNTAIGRRSLYASANNIQNVIAIGNEAASQMTGIGFNIAMGLQSAYAVSSTYNIAMGDYTLYSGVSNNVALGFFAAPGLTTSNNVVIGYNAARYQNGGTTNLTTAYNSVYIGATTKGTQGVENENVFGYTAQGKGSNSVNLGNTSVTAVWHSESVGWFRGSGSPEGVVTAPVGSIYSRTDGSAGNSFYVKEVGSGNTGWVRMSQNFSGTYTPTLTSVANVASSSAGKFKITRVGTNVTFAGQITVTPTAAANTTTTIEISLGIVSNFTTAFDATGNATCDVINAFRSGIVQAESTNDRLILNFSSNTTSPTVIAVSGTYEIL